MSYDKNILITGGAGFIGSHLVSHFVKKYPMYRIVNFDALTYAGNLSNLYDIEGRENYEFLHADIKDNSALADVFDKYEITDVIHLAAESHVDRSISDPLAFVTTNVIGTCNLLNVCKECWTGDGHRFYHISTDEVYGSLGSKGMFTEKTAYDPRSPYSASKASSDHFVRAYHHTYGLPVVLSNCSNNYGPYQFPEKLIPLIINNILSEKPLPVYGDGLQVRDWLYVQDHVEAIDIIFHRGEIGETYNIGGDNELANIDLVKTLCELVDDKLGNESGYSRQLITFVKDRPGHDRRYAIDASKIQENLGWQPIETVESGLKKTIEWYLGNKKWLTDLTTGAYQKYYKEQYSH